MLKSVFVVAILWLWGLGMGWVMPVQAVTWKAIATPLDPQHIQYVDLESIEIVTDRIVRLNSYWMDIQQPDSRTDAVTEYQCDRALYRDMELNGQPQTQPWGDVTADPLNQAVMEYACNPS